MIHFDLPKQKSSIIKVLGVGGGGSNAVNYMFGENIEGVDFIICNTDAKALEQSKITNKIQLGPHLTQGLGAGANPEVGKQATEESLEEIKRILEVNTRMAFICAGMGGGTGTGGAPIIAKICRELGILTVGIVTTPFPFEGPRRIAQAENGIRQLEPFVDTLLVISNDKLRMQYGNLKMREAFGKADNILATAAKCITDIINSRGHIIVDFADVCTVMKNGGVAILGSSAVGGEDRAQRAIEQALNSPLLNDNDISGAKWILININSAEGDNECTMDELEIINNHLRAQAGEFSDVIVGMGYDNALEDKIGITLIATGFEQRDPFAKADQAQKKPEPKEEKIIMTLGIEGEERKQYRSQVPPPVKEANPLMPVLSENSPEPFAKTQPEAMPAQEENMVLQFDFIQPQPTAVPQQKTEEPVQVRMEYTEKPAPQPAGNAHNGTYLNRPSNIYTEPAKQQVPARPAEASKPQAYVQQPQASRPVPASPKPEPQQPPVRQPQAEMPRPSSYMPQQEPVKPAYAQPAPKPQEPAEDETPMMELVIKDTPPASPAAPQPPVHPHYGMGSEEDDKRMRAQERLAKLRNLSYNMSSPEVSSEFDNVPAYVRRNMELYGNALASAENYYSKVTVNKDDNNETQLSTLNTFLDGKKPD